MAEKKNPRNNPSFDASQSLSVQSNNIQHPLFDYNKLAKAFRKEIKKEIGKQSRRSLWENSVVAIILFLLSVIVSLLLYIVTTLQK